MNLKELAASLNLSPTTVSRALNGYPEVREETRARVLAAARAANYQPNRGARRLATGRSMTIGHVIPAHGPSELVNPMFADFIAGAGDVYAREGYDLLLSIVSDDEDAERAYRQMKRHGSVDGVLVQSPLVHDRRVALLQELGLPFLVHGRTTDPSGYSWLDVANTRAMRRATELLLDLGHRRIALINGPEENDFAARRRKGFEQAMAARGVPIRPELCRANIMTEGFGYRAAREMFDRPDPPTAFVTASVLIAAGVRRAIWEGGMKLGRDVSVVTHDDMLSYLYSDSSDAQDFTATRSSIREAGRRCAEILLERIDDPDAPPVQELWEADLTLGRSTGPAPSHQKA